MGPLSQILEMIPGIGQAVRQQNVQVGDDEFKNVEAIIHSMTVEERRYPEIIKPSRRKRIAAGSGTTQAEVNQLLATVQTDAEDDGPDRKHGRRRSTRQAAQPALG